MRFSVPQFVEIENKILGPLSWRQFGELAAAGIISFICYFLFVGWAWFLISVFCFGIASIFAFWKPYGLRADQVIFSAIKHFSRPKLYFWQTPEKKIEVEVEEVPVPKKERKKEIKLRITKEDFKKLAKILDKR